MEKIERNSRRTLIGTVVSDKMDKTVVVALVENRRHPVYGKVYKFTTKYKAHDEKNECHVGDTVELMETRHLSRDKYYRVVRIIERAK